MEGHMDSEALAQYIE